MHVHAVAVKLCLDESLTMQRVCGLTRTTLLQRPQRSLSVRSQCRSLRLQARAEYLDSSAATINTEKYSMSADKYTTIKNPTATLSNGQKIPLFGLGTWRGEAGQVENAIEMALRAGYRYDRSGSL